MNSESTSTKGELPDPSRHSPMSKRGAAQQRIQQFFFQLTQGCGRSNCVNPDCASNPAFIKLSSDNAAARAIKLYRDKSELCEKPPSKIPRTDSINNDLTSSPIIQNSSNGSGETSSSVLNVNGKISETDSVPSTEEKKVETNSATNTEHTSEEETPAENINKKLQDITVNEAKTSQNSASFKQESSTLDQYETDFTILARIKDLNTSSDSDVSLSSIKQSLWRVFSNPDCLNRFALIKEDFKSQQSRDEDKDVDETDANKETKCSKFTKLSMDDLDDESQSIESSITTEHCSTKAPLYDNKHSHPTVNMNIVRELYKNCIKHPQLDTVMFNAVSYLINSIEQQLTVKPNAYKHDPNYLNMFVVLMENKMLQNPEAFDRILPSFCKVLGRLPVSAQAALARYWSQFDEIILRNLVENLQQLITIKVVTELGIGEDSSNLAHENEGIIAASRCLNILFYASILGGKVDKSVDESAAPSSVTSVEDERTEQRNFTLGLLQRLEQNSPFAWIDPLGKELKINKLDSVKALVPLSEFVNEPLNDSIKIEKDYANYRISEKVSSKFSFLHFPFLLNTVSKTAHLFCDNRITMYSESHRTLMSSLMQGGALRLHLKIHVRRTHIIEDALVQLELATENAKDLKKQLFVEFDGEEGVDEGGVSKEFFQLVIDEIFNPENGMFVYNEDTRLFWFNPYSFEDHSQYKLIGIVLGLAIYNNCILNINFPSFIYKKLLGRKAKFNDMADYNPVLYRSLQDLLQYEGNVEEDIMATFRVQFEDVFGHTHSHDLKEGGENIPVTAENRQEYVDLYADWLLNDSIREQFNSFRGGFDLVVSDSLLKYLFDQNELELLIRGSETYDFEELERTTDYDGFNKNSQTITDFWEVVHGFSEEEKRSLLQFSTGSDRAPVGGLAKLKMIIAQNGPDSNRLPTAHTCFNVILLPDYKNKEKLKERLLKAIKYSKGFGML